MRNTTIALVGMLALVCLSFYSSQQTFLTDPPAEDIFYAPTGHPNWLAVKEDVRITPQDVITTYKSHFGLEPVDELRLLRTHEDNLGFTHYRYQHYHRQVKVEGSQLLVHEKQGRVKTVNGKLGKKVSARGAAPALSPEEAIELGKKYVPAEQYMWEDWTAQLLHARVHGKESKGFYPQPELVWIDPSFTLKGNFHLAYRLTIDAQKPLARQELYIDAQNGKLIQFIDKLHTTDVPSKGQTKYVGVQDIITDSVDTDLFRLQESTRGNGIFTYNLQRQDQVSQAVDFTHDDSFWDITNEFQDEAAIDCHWGSEKTYDYLLSQFGWDGINGTGGALISYVHFSNNVTNAFWNGSWATFGDGNGVSTTALTCLDVVAHEYGHGITDFTNDLVYRYESGALNESFSDILGTALEFWADPANADWFIAEDIYPNLDRGFRSMDNPRIFGDPDTYRGKDWHEEESDNGGVHINSGVQNHWFYLLSEGGKGVNDLGNRFDISRIGIDSAMQIVFRNWQYYLFRTSDYEDAREGALQAAIDIYGPCSEPVRQTANAWYAVGIGDPLIDKDIEITKILNPELASCGLDETIFPRLQLQLNGCTGLAAGDSIFIGIQVDNNSLIQDTIFVPFDLAGGDILSYELNKPITGLDVWGNYEFAAWATVTGDQMTANDTLKTMIFNAGEQNVDFAIQSLNLPGDGCFLEELPLSAEVVFWGCESMPAGTELDICFQLNNGSSICETTTTPENLFFGDSFTYYFQNPIDFTSSIGANSINAWARFAEDTFVANDTVYNQIVRNPYALTVGDQLIFDFAEASLDSIFLSANEYADVYLSEASARFSPLGLHMTGGKVNQAIETGQVSRFLNAEQVWESNEALSAKACFCVDATNLTSLDLKFAIRQTYSTYYDKIFFDDNKFRSSLRVLVDGEQVGNTFNPKSNSQDLYLFKKVKLDDFVGNKFEVCFETRNGLSPEEDPFDFGDNAYIDNVSLEGDQIVNTTEVPQWINEARVFPNPFSSQQFIEFDLPEKQWVEVTLLNALGQPVKTLAQANLPAGLQRFTWEGKDDQGNPLAAGLYHCKIKSEEGIKSFGLILQR